MYGGQAIEKEDLDRVDQWYEDHKDDHADEFVPLPPKATTTPSQALPRLEDMITARQAIRMLGYLPAYWTDPETDPEQKAMYLMMPPPPLP